MKALNEQARSQRTTRNRIRTPIRPDSHSSDYWNYVLGESRNQAGGMSQEVLCGGADKTDRKRKASDSRNKLWRKSSGKNSAACSGRARFNSHGFATLGACLLLLTFMFGAGARLAINHTRAITQRQVNMDQCTGAAALKMREFLITLESSYQRLEVERLALIAISVSNPLLLPEMWESYKRLAQLEQKIQLTIKHKWGIEKARWDVFPGAGCKLRGRPERSPYPEFTFPIVDPNLSFADLKMLRYQFEVPSRYDLSLNFAKLESQASLTRLHVKVWSAKWTL